MVGFATPDAWDAVPSVWYHVIYAFPAEVGH